MASNHKSSDDQKMSREEAGRLGGQETAKKGEEFYSEIGSQQGKENNPGNFANRSEQDVKAAAQEGGRNSHRDSSDTDEAA